MTQPSGPLAPCADALVAALALADEVVTKTIQIDRSIAQTVEVWLNKEHSACDVYMQVLGPPATGVAAFNPTQLFAIADGMSEVVSRGRYSGQLIGENQALVPYPATRVASARGRAASKFRFTATNVPVAPLKVQVVITMIGYGKLPATADQESWWWPPANTQGSGAISPVLLNWDCPVTGPCKMQGFTAWDTRTSTAGGGVDTLMFFDEVTTLVGGPPGNGSNPLFAIPLPPNPSCLIVDFSNRPRRFVAGVTWALSTSQANLTLDTSAVTLARVDVETN